MARQLPDGMLYAIRGRVTPPMPPFPDGARVPPPMRQAVLDRDGQECLRCVSMGRETTGPLQMDHVHDRAHGGRTTLENLQPLCGPCNKWKGDRSMDFRPSPFDRDLSGCDREWASARADREGAASPRGFDRDLSGETVSFASDQNTPNRLTFETVFQLHQERQQIWRWWVEGDIPGCPHDDSALNRAQNLASERMRGGDTTG